MWCGGDIPGLSLKCSARCLMSATGEGRIAKVIEKAMWDQVAGAGTLGGEG